VVLSEPGSSVADVEEDEDVCGSTLDVVEPSCVPAVDVCEVVLPSGGGSSVSEDAVDVDVEVDEDVEPSLGATHSPPDGVCGAKRRPLSQEGSGKLHPPLGSQEPRAPHSSADSQTNIGPAPHANMHASTRAPTATSLPTTPGWYRDAPGLETGLVPACHDATLAPCPTTSFGASRAR